MEYASNEEKFFSWYLDELKESGYIISYESQPESFLLSVPLFYEFDKQLKTKTKIIVKKHIPEHVYTADFRIEWAENARYVFLHSFGDRVNLKKVPFLAEKRISYIEVKPDYDVHNMQREFSINQKWVWQIHKVYVQKVIVSVKLQYLFAQTFTPNKFLFTPTGKIKKLHYQAMPLKEFVEKVILLNQEEINDENKRIHCNGNCKTRIRI